MYGPTGWVTPVSSEEAHGDQWVARIRAKHERLGTDCPCGNTRHRTLTTETHPRTGTEYGVRCTACDWTRLGFEYRLQAERAGRDHEKENA